MKRTTQTLKSSPPPARPGRPEDFDLLRSAAQDNKHPCASVCLPAGREGGGGGESLAPLLCGPLCPSAQPVCFSKPARDDLGRETREAQEALSAAGARHRRPIKAVGTPCSERSQLGRVRTQIFEECPTVPVPLARHHRLLLPKQQQQQQKKRQSTVVVGNVQNTCALRPTKLIKWTR